MLKSLIRPPGGTKPSKAPLYAEALRIYLTEPNSTLPAIAERVGLRADSLIANAERQAWSKRRALVIRDQSQIRSAAVVQVDETLVAATVRHVDTLTDEWEKIVREVQNLSVEIPKEITDEQLKSRAKAQLIERKAQLLKLTSQGFRELADVAERLGLIKTPAAEGKDAKPDFSKLTQLNVVITRELERVDAIEIEEDLV